MLTGRSSTALFARVRHTLARSSVHALGLRISWAVANYSATLAAGRWLSRQDFGVFGFINNAILLAVAIASLGSPLVMLRYVAQYRVRSDPGAALGLTRHLQRRVAWTGMFVFALCAIGTLAAWRLGRIASPVSFLLGLAAIPFVALLDFYSATLRGHRYLALALAPREIAWRGLMIPVIFFVAVWAVPPAQLPLVMALQTVIAALLCLFQALLLRRVHRRAFADIEPVAHTAEWTAVGRPLWLSTIAATIFRTSDVIVLGIFLRPELVGLYFAAARTAELARFFLTALNGILAPMISSRYHGDQQNALQSLCSRAAWMVFWPSAVLAAAMMLFPNQILRLVGDNFHDAATVLVILAAARLVDAAFGAVGTVLNVTGHERAAATALVTVGLSTIILQIVLSRWLGLTGAAIATAVSIVAWNVWLYVIVLRRVGIDPSIFGCLRRRMNGNDSR